MDTSDIFHRLVVRFSKEAEQAKIKRVHLLALQNRRNKIKEKVFCGIVIMLYVVGYFKYTEINNAVVMLFSSKVPECESILKFSDKVTGYKSGIDNPPRDPAHHKAGLNNEAFKKAKERAAMLDEIMNNAPNDEKQ